MRRVRNTIAASEKVLGVVVGLFRLVVVAVVRILEVVVLVVVAVGHLEEVVLVAELP